MQTSRTHTSRRQVSRGQTSRRPARRCLLLALATAAASLTVAFADGGETAGAVGDVPSGASWETTHFPSLDGTMLQADILKPADGCPPDGCPTIVSIGPYYGYGTQSLHNLQVWDPTNAGPSDRFDDFIEHRFGDRGNIFDQGYAFVMVDSRGYGESGGCNDYGGIGEQMDAAAAVEWAGSQEWSNGRVGMWGKSYDAWTQVMALAMNPPHLEAVVIQAPIIDGYGIAWVNGVHHDVGWYVTPFLYTLYDYTPTSLRELTVENVLYPTAGSATDPCWAENHPYSAAGFDRTLEYWRERDLRPRASRNDDVAVLWAHGFNDVNTKPDQIFGVYEPLNDLPASNHRAWFGQWAHDRGNEVAKVGRSGFLEEALDWFDHYLKGQPFRFGANEHDVVEVQDNEGKWRTEATYPPADVERIALELNPGTYRDDHSGGASSGYWTFSQVLTEELRIAGEPELSVTAEIAAPHANFVGVLYDYDPGSGRAVEIARTAVRLLESGAPHVVRMHPRDHVLRPGHRLAFHVTANHPEFQPHPTLQDVTVTALSVEVPFLTYERVSNLTGGPASSSAFSISVPPSLVESAVKQLALPDTIPFPDAETRERYQPTVTTGSD